MKLRCALVLFLAACVCSFGQSASTILSSLRIKGATTEGGDPKYENYVPRLDTNGTLSLTFLPDYMYTNIYAWVDEHGSTYDRQIIETAASSIDTRVRAALTPVYSEIVLATNAVFSTVTNIIPSYETDPVFSRLVMGTSISIGRGAEAVTGAVQIGSGTNTTSGTLQFKDITIIDTNGVIPRVTVPWAASVEDVNDIFRSATSNSLLKSGDTMLGCLGIKNEGTYAATFIRNTDSTISLDGTVTFNQANEGSAYFSGLYYISPESVLSDILSPGFTKVKWACTFDDTTAGYTYTNNISDSTTVLTFLDVTGPETATSTVSVYTNGVLAETSVSSAPIENVTEIEDTGALLYRLASAPNPSGITLNSINEPVSFVDIKSPSGLIYRLTCTDAGDLVIKKIK